MRTFWLRLVALSIAIGFLAWLFVAMQRPSELPLVVHVAASQRAVIEEIAQAFERDTGIRTELRFGGSQDLLSKLDISREGDVFLPADVEYVTLAQSRKLVASVKTVAYMRAVALTQAGNPKHLATLADLSREGVKLVQANRQIAAIGKLTYDTLHPLGQWDALDARTVAYVGTVTEVANSVKAGAADVGIVWDAVAHLHPQLTVVSIPELDGVRAEVRIATLTTSKQPQRAERFVDYVTDPALGKAAYARHGFRVAP